MKYEQQLELLLNKPREATPEECAEWERTDYFRSGNFDAMKLFVVVPTVIQLFMFFLMLGIFAVNEKLF